MPLIDTLTNIFKTVQPIVQTGTAIYNQVTAGTKASAVTGFPAQSFMPTVSGINVPITPAQTNTQQQTGMTSVSGSYDIGLLPIIAIVVIFLLAKRFLK